MKYKYCLTLSIQFLHSKFCQCLGLNGGAKWSPSLFVNVQFLIFGKIPFDVWVMPVLCVVNFRKFVKKHCRSNLLLFFFSCSLCREEFAAFGVAFLSLPESCGAPFVVCRGWRTACAPAARNLRAREWRSSKDVRAETYCVWGSEDFAAED